MKLINNCIARNIKTIFFMALTCCTSFGGKSENEFQNSTSVEAIKITSNVPVILDNGKLENETDSLDVVEFENYFIYVIPRLTESYKASANHSGDVSHKIFVGNKISYKYLIAAKGNLYGDLYDSLNAHTGKKTNIDTFLLQQGFLGCNFYNAFSVKATDSLVQRIFLNKSNVLEKYVTVRKTDESYNDTTYLYFTKDLTDIDFSFCKELDRAKNMKLYKSRFIYNKTFTNKYSFPLPARELWYSIQRTTIKDKMKLIAFINSKKQ